MGHAALKLPMSASDFLAWDALQRVKHEFVRGEVFAMAGASESHVTAALNIAMALRRHLQGSPCSTFISDMKLRVDAADAFYYPDVMVCCSAADKADALVKREPLLLVEVLSPSTAGVDRGDKFSAYRLLPSLQELAFVDPDSRRCDVMRKGSDGLWVLHPFGRSEDLRLASVSLAIDAATLWADMPAEPSAADPPSEPSA